MEELTTAKNFNMKALRALTLSKRDEIIDDVMDEFMSEILSCVWDAAELGESSSSFEAAWFEGAPSWVPAVVYRKFIDLGFSVDVKDGGFKLEWM